MTDTLQETFAIEIDYAKGRDAPSRVFKALADMIEAAERADRILARSLAVQVEPVLTLENIETGSIRGWFRTVVNALPDEVIGSGEVKKVVGHFLVQAKRAIIAWTDRHTRIETREQVDELRGEIRRLAEQTNIHWMPAYTAPAIRELADIAVEFRDAARELSDGEHMRFRVGDDALTISATIEVSPERLEDLVTERTVTNRAEMIVKVKRPDFLGDARWDLRHGNRTISASIEDHSWIARYRRRDPETVLMPGDAISTDMRVEAAYGFDGELVRETYTIERIIRVVRPELDQATLHLGPGSASEGT